MKDNYEFKFVPGAITFNEYNLLKEIIINNNIQKIIEFGSGETTKLFNSLVKTCISYEESEEWANKSKFDVRVWNKKDFTIKLKSDFILIDGPKGSNNREISFKIAIKNKPKFIAVHDYKNVPNTKWQNIYLSDKYEQISSKDDLTIWKRI